MENHKIFKTAAIPFILMIIGLNHFTQNLALSIIAGIDIYLFAFLVDTIV